MSEKNESTDLSKSEKVTSTNTISGTSGEGQPLFAKPIERFHYTSSEYFVAIKDSERGTVALMPIGWVGEPSLIIAEIRLDDLKALLKQL